MQDFYRWLWREGVEFSCSIQDRISKRYDGKELSSVLIISKDYK